MTGRVRLAGSGKLMGLYFLIGVSIHNLYQLDQLVVHLQRFAVPMWVFILREIKRSRREFNTAFGLISSTPLKGSVTLFPI